MANLGVKWKDVLAEHCNRKQLPRPDYVVSSKNGRQEVSLTIPAENFSETIDSKSNFSIAENNLALKAVQSLTELNIDGPSARQHLNQYSQKHPFNFQPIFSYASNSYIAKFTFQDIEITSSPFAKKKEAEQDLAKKILHQIAKTSPVEITSSENPLANSQTVITSRSRLNEYCQKNNISPLVVSFDDAYLPKFGGSAIFNKIVFESNEWNTKKEVEEDLATQICEHIGITEDPKEEEEVVERVVDMSPGKAEVPVSTENFISRVNEYAQKNRLDSPTYSFDTEGPPHTLIIYAIANWRGKTIRSRGCKTKSEAKNEAAKKLWDEIIYPDLIPSPKAPSSPRIVDRPSPAQSPVSPNSIRRSHLSERREQIFDYYEVLQSSTISVSINDILPYLEDDDPIIKRIASYCSEIVLHRDKSAKYWHNHYLDTSDFLASGFYDVGRSVKPFPTLLELSKQPKHERECILFDTAKDERIKKFLEEVKSEVGNIKDIKDKVLYISKRVWERMGKSDLNLVEKSDKNIFRLQEEGKSRVVLLGSIEYGVCRHRALLFKIAADACGIKSRLIRGKMDNENHAWNVVKIMEEYYLVDVTNDHNQLLKEGAVKTEIYKRNGGNIGGKSVDGHELLKYEDFKEEGILGESNHIVYEVSTTKGGIKKEYAMKKIKYGESERDNKFREVVIYRQLKHPNIVKFVTSFETKDINNKTYLCIVMEKLGKSLEKYELSSEIEFIAFSLDIAKALHYLHKEFNKDGTPIIHRDVKPANILVDTEKKIAKLCDFGIAKNGNPTTREIGTEGFMAPELNSENKQLSHKIDVFSYGRTLKALLKNWKGSSDLNENMKGFIEEMTRDDPGLRPEFVHICNYLIRLLKEKSVEQ